MDPGLVESSGSLLLIAHLSLGRICFPTHKRSSSCFLFPPAALSSRDHRNPAASVRIAPEEEDPQRRRGKMVEGTGQEIPEARTLRPVGCNLAVQSRPQTFSSLARREYQGCSKVFSRLERTGEIREGGEPARVRYRRSKSRLNPIDGIDRAFWDEADTRGRR